MGKRIADADVVGRVYSGDDDGCHWELKVLIFAPSRRTPKGKLLRRVILQCYCGSEPFEIDLRDVGVHTKSCGCRRGKTRQRPIIPGERFSGTNQSGFSWEIATVCQAGTRRHLSGTVRRLAEFRCHCGSLFVAVFDDVVHGHTRSCGCLRNNTAAKRNTDSAVARFREAVPCLDLYLTTEQIREQAAGFNSYFYMTRTQATKRGAQGERQIGWSGDVFTLTPELLFIKTQGDCVRCGKKPSPDCDGFVRNGVDRVNNNEGYTDRNTVSCCEDCNYDKGSLSEDELLERDKRGLARLLFGEKKQKDLLEALRAKEAASDNSTPANEAKKAG